MPAKAGTHATLRVQADAGVASRLRGNDDASGLPERLGAFPADQFGIETDVPELPLAELRQLVPIARAPQPEQGHRQRLHRADTVAVNQEALEARKRALAALRPRGLEVADPGRAFGNFGAKRW